MTARDEPIVYIVDDDSALRDSLRWLLESVGLKTVSHAHPQDFLENYPPGQAGCLLLDVRMPDMSGLHLQQQLPKLGIHLPVIIITGHGDVPTAVAAMKHGALDFIEKPFNEQLLLDCVQNALHHDQEYRQIQARNRAVAERFESLTHREREVMELVVQGLPNKAIADALKVSRKTVEVHRAKVMEKMNAQSLSDLIQMAMAVNILKEYAADNLHA